MSANTWIAVALCVFLVGGFVFLQIRKRKK
jgi:LPXTG-motif cell wall-anchored protein